MKRKMLLEKNWDLFSRVVLSEHNDFQRSELKKAFYAGAMTTHRILSYAARSEKSMNRALDDLQDSFEIHIQDLKKEVSKHGTPWIQ